MSLDLSGENKIIPREPNFNLYSSILGVNKCVLGDNLIKTMLHNIKAATLWQVFNSFKFNFFMKWRLFFWDVAYKHAFVSRNHEASWLRVTTKFPQMALNQLADSTDMMEHDQNIASWEECKNRNGDSFIEQIGATCIACTLIRSFWPYDSLAHLRPHMRPGGMQDGYSYFWVPLVKLSDPLVHDGGRTNDQDWS